MDNQCDYKQPIHRNKHTKLKNIPDYSWEKIELLPLWNYGWTAIDIDEWLKSVFLYDGSIYEMISY